MKDEGLEHAEPKPKVVTLVDSEGRKVVPLARGLPQGKYLKNIIFKKYNTEFGLLIDFYFVKPSGKIW